MLVAAFVTMTSAAESVMGAKGHPAAFLAANDDTSVPFPPSTVSFYEIRGDGSLAPPTRVSTQGNGMAGGFFGTDRLLVVASGARNCVFASNAQSESIAAFDGASQALTGVFRGSHEDTVLAPDGIGLAASGDRLYATFSAGGNVGAFEIVAGCKLRFLGDASARGLGGGPAEALSVRANMMVVAYGDGSIESFDVSGRLPVRHGDALYPAGGDDDFVPGAVAMTSDGHYAIFGGASTATVILVADLSRGRLGAVTRTRLGPAWNSGSVRLSPDEAVLYVSNSSGGRITAAYFDGASGNVRPGCTSDALHGFYKKFTYVGAVAPGAGGLLYVPEFDAGGNSSIGIVRFTSEAEGCTLRETSQSPVAAGPRSALLSIAIAK
jgi:hypothetical protein